MHLSLSTQTLISWLQNCPAEISTLITLVACGITIMVMVHFYGAMGLKVYNILAVVIANFQVQLATYFAFFHEPVALGTVVFSSTFIASSILTEYYGEAEARDSVWLSFIGMAVMSCFITITLGVTPAPDFQETYNAMQVIFLPIPSLIASSLVAYVIGQYNNIWVFSALSRLTKTKLLWLRSALAVLIGAFIDNCVFSILAWRIFAPHPLPWGTVFFTYVLGGYFLRILISLFGIPFIYSIRWVKK